MPPFPPRDERFMENFPTWMREVEGRRPPPSPIREDDESDLRLAAFLNELCGSEPAVRTTVADRLHWPADDRLSAFAGRMATLAVRTGTSRYLERAVVALALAFQVARDWRDVLVIYPLPYDAARRIGLDPDALYLAAAECAPAQGSESLRSFTRRNEEDKSLAVMGFRVGADDDGFRYVRDN
jgi:hypothetical protein